MSKTQKQAGGDESPKVSSTTITDRIGENVLRVLGRPQHFLRIQVKNLWEGAYRANVFVGDTEHVEVPHSFFLRTTSEGDIVTSNPSLKRVY